MQHRTPVLKRVGVYPRLPGRVLVVQRPLTFETATPRGRIGEAPNIRYEVFLLT